MLDNRILFLKKKKKKKVFFYVIQKKKLKYHNSMAYLYYDLSQSDSDDAWWYIRKEGKGYHIINAKDNTFITRSDERIPNVAKGLVLSVNPMGTDSQWQIVENDYGYVTVQSVSTPAQWWNLRKDGSYLLGTYPGTGSDNELFKIFDEDGNDIVAGQSGSESTLHSMVDSLRIYNKQLVYDSSSKRYFCSLPQTPASRRRLPHHLDLQTQGCLPGLCAEPRRTNPPMPKGKSRLKMWIAARHTSWHSPTPKARKWPQPKCSSPFCPWSK